jgi:signal transduction histidine kinase
MAQADGAQMPEGELAVLLEVAYNQLRVPLANLKGATATLAVAESEELRRRCLELLNSAVEDLTEQFDELVVLARIQLGVFEPTLIDIDSLELARGAAAAVDDRVITVTGSGTVVRVSEYARHALKRLAYRTVGANRVAGRRYAKKPLVIEVKGPLLILAPVAPALAQAIRGELFPEPSIAAATGIIRAFGGSVGIENNALFVRLPV